MACLTPGCLKITVEYTSWHDTEAIVSMVIACSGFVFAVWIGSVFVRHNNTPVVSQSSRPTTLSVLAWCRAAFPEKRPS